MPIYEYKCGKCGRISEFLEGRAEAGKRKCPHCGSSKLNKQLSVFAALVKEGESKRCLGCTDNTCPHSQG